MRLTDALETFRDRARTASSERELHRLERALAAIYTDADSETPTPLLAFVAPDIRARRRELARAHTQD